MHKLSRALSGVLVAVVLAACKDPLTVTNVNNPDRIRVLGTPADLENYTAGAFRSMFQATIGGSDDNIPSQTRVMSFENSSSLANFGMSARGAVPRNFIDNGRGNQVSAGNLKDYNLLSRAARSAADGINRMSVGGISLGSAAQDARIKAFAWFTLGASLGQLALVYDSSTIINPYEDLSFIPPLSGYADLMAAALRDLDSALTWTTTAGTAAGSNGFPLPAGWINGNALTGAQFGQLVHSYKAWLRADVARTPAARAAVRWDSVLIDAVAGITADLNVTYASSPAWTAALNQIYLYAQWGQFSSFIAGMADSSGAYDAWLAAPLANKVPFLIQTKDQRFPSGGTRAAQQLASGFVPGVSAPLPQTTVMYFRNRSGGDSPSDVYGQSQYDFYRFQAFYNAQRIGTGGPALFTKNHNDMLRAEALIRTNDFTGAMAQINPYRTRAGLPALTGITSLTQPVPGGVSCVPRIPVGTGPVWTGTTCGNILEAMKWEFRMENMYVGYSAWFFPARGWGDLPEGTPLNWPVPWQEMDTRLLAFYNLGGVGGTDGAVGKGTYGL
jgi:hypothetical protein